MVICGVNNELPNLDFALHTNCLNVTGFAQSVKQEPGGLLCNAKLS